MFSRRMLNLGFATALCIAMLILIGSMAYLFLFLFNVNHAVELLLTSTRENSGAPISQVLSVRLAATGFAFNSCGLFIGIAIAFLGMALFLVGIKGEMDASAEKEKFSFKIARMSPGALAIICASVIVVACVVNRPSLVITPTEIRANPIPQPSGQP